MKKKTLIFIGILLLFLLLFLIFNPTNNSKKKINKLNNNGYVLNVDKTYIKLIDGISEDDYYDSYESKKNSETYKIDISTNTLTYQFYKYNNYLEISIYVNYDKSKNIIYSYYSKDYDKKITYISCENKINDINVNNNCTTKQDDYGISTEAKKELENKIKNTIEEYKKIA